MIILRYQKKHRKKVNTMKKLRLKDLRYVVGGWVIVKDGTYIRGVTYYDGVGYELGKYLNNNPKIGNQKVTSIDASAANVLVITVTE